MCVRPRSVGDAIADSVASSVALGTLFPSVSAYVRPNKCANLPEKSRLARVVRARAANCSYY